MTNDETTNNVYDLDKNYELAKGIVSDILNDKPVNAMDKVNDVMLDKVRDVIAGKKVEIAQNLLNPEPQQEVEPEIEDEDEEEYEVVDDQETETEEEDEDVQGDQ